MNRAEAFKLLSAGVPAILAKHDGVSEYELRNLVRESIGQQVVEHLKPWLIERLRDRFICTRGHLYHLSNQIVTGPYL